MKKNQVEALDAARMEKRKEVLTQRRIESQMDLDIGTENPAKGDDPIGMDDASQSGTISVADRLKQYFVGKKPAKEVLSGSEEEIIDDTHFEQ